MNLHDFLICIRIILIFVWNHFNESFGDDVPVFSKGQAVQEEGKDIIPLQEEEKHCPQSKEDLYSIKNQRVKEGTEQFLLLINKDISESNDKLDEIIKETKKTSKPLPMGKLPQINPFNTDGMTEDEKRLRRNMIIKIRNHIDCFSDNEII